MNSDARELRFGDVPYAPHSIASPYPAAPASAPVNAARTSGGRLGRLRSRLSTIWGAPLTDADIELTAEDIQAQLDYGRD